MNERPPFDKFAPLSKPELGAVPSFGDMIREEASCGKMPVPASAPAMPDSHRELGEPSARWAYRADAIEGWPDTAALRNAAAGSLNHMSLAPQRSGHDGTSRSLCPMACCQWPHSTLRFFPRLSRPGSWIFQTGCNAHRISSPFQPLSPWALS